MCGPADFEALSTCITRVAELSAAGLTTYSVCKAASLCRELRPNREKRKESGLRNAPGKLVAEGSSGRHNP